MQEESRTEFIQFCDKKRLCGACDTKRYAKIYNLRIFAFISIPERLCRKDAMRNSRRRFLICILMYNNTSNLLKQSITKLKV